MSERRDGWYWIKESHNAKWEATQWEHGQWCGDSEQFIPAVIGHRIPSPDEPWVCVPSDGSTSDMDDACRAFLMLLPSTTFGDARNHIKRYSGSSALSSWPPWAMDAEGHISKAAQADIIFRMMTSAAPSPDDTP